MRRGWVFGKKKFCSFKVKEVLGFSNVVLGYKLMQL